MRSSLLLPDSTPAPNQSLDRQSTRMIDHPFAPPAAPPLRRRVIPPTPGRDGKDKGGNLGHAALLHHPRPSHVSGVGCVGAIMVLPVAVCPSACRADTGPPVKALISPAARPAWVGLGEVAAPHPPNVRALASPPYRADVACLHGAASHAVSSGMCMCARHPPLAPARFRVWRG